MAAVTDGVEYRVKWRDSDGERQVKRFSDPQAAADFVAVLMETTAVEVRYQARRVDAWQDVDG